MTAIDRDPQTVHLSDLEGEVIHLAINVSALHGPGVTDPFFGDVCGKVRLIGDTAWVSNFAFRPNALLLSKPEDGKNHFALYCRALTDEKAYA